jgi:predicted transglutaminase-like cysteine proteinase
MLAFCLSAPARAVSALPGVDAAGTPPFPSVFGAREAAGSNFSAFKRWTAVLERIVHEAPAYDEPCALRFANRCIVAEWRQMIAQLRTKSRREQIDGVNAYFNRFPYTLDLGNWGVSDYWASPLQFLARSGDCEDYAIAKFVSLRQLGFANGELRIVVLDDVNLKVAHAVLVVADGPRLLVLDNQIPQVVESTRILHYKPIYSINKERWWLHRGK